MRNTLKNWVSGAVGKISAGLAALGAVIVSSVPSVDAASLIDTWSVATLQTESVTMIGDLLDTIVAFSPWLLTLVAFGFIMGILKKKLKA